MKYRITNYDLRLNNKGFTLIETLIGLAVVGVIGAVLATLLGRTFQSNNKTSLISTIRQNGQSALTQIDQTIRQADSIICVGNTTQNRTIALIKNGSYTRISVYPQVNSPAQNGYIAIDYPALTNDPGPTANCANPSSLGGPIKRCPNSFCELAQSNPNTLTDNDPVNGVSVVAKSTGQYFTLMNNLGTKDSLKVDFSLSPGIQAGTSVQSQIGPNNQVNFQTTIELR